MSDQRSHRLRLSWGGATDQGRVRANNQDAMYADWGLFVVADGMGGHQGGEVAANLAVRAVTKAERSSTNELRDAVAEANRLVHDTAIAQPELHGMGTTLTVLAISQQGDENQFVVL
ncbi:MAG: protein phosphatase 2C domain-containing protein, partial [Actinomycetota bacterium]|nr:protein phosphatase 2C domain-containing protein [Actinomycetota bacterium]